MATENLSVEAIADQVAEQAAFVAWWEGSVSVNHGAGRGKKNTVRGSFSAKEAEKNTGITHQQVSRWRKRLAMRHCTRAPA